MKPSVIAVANRLIGLDPAQGTPASCAMTHMRVQKLCYLVYAHHLIANGARPTEEQPELWKHGPGFTSLYLALQYAGTRPIDSLIRLPYGVPTLNENGALAIFVDGVATRYAAMPTLALADLCSGDGGAWRRSAAKAGYRCPAGTVMADAMIADERSRLVA